MGRSEEGWIHAGPWSGAVTHCSAVIKASVDSRCCAAAVLVATDPGFAEPIVCSATSIWNDPAGKYHHTIVSFELTGLVPETQYYYMLALDGREQPRAAGRLRTFPQPGKRSALRIAFGSCSGNNSVINLRFPENQVYAAIEQEPDAAFFLHLGDFHYGNIRRPVLQRRLRKYDWMLRRASVQSMLRALPVAYIWDDHDFLGDDTEGGLPQHHAAALSALNAYDLSVPHYPLIDRKGGVYQSFVFGRVLFLLADNRFNKVTKGIPEYARTMLGQKQKAWLMRMLQSASDYDLVVWGNSLPWVGKAEEFSDFWSAHHDERTEISTFIRDKGIRNLCMLSGDAHMLAIDDGTYSDFAPGGGGGFPVFHAAALESRPSHKGGMFSKGRKDGSAGKGIAGSAQYGVMEVRYERDAAGNEIGMPEVLWTGKKIHGSAKKYRTEILLTHEFKISAAKELVAQH